jgi:hypothetical protein
MAVRHPAQEGKTMKKLFTAFVLLAALGCIAATAAGAAVVSRSTFHSDFVFTDICSGEDVHVVGDVSFLTTSTVNDNVISGTTHSVFKAVGTGLSSGLTYRESVEFNRAFESSLQNGEATVTQKGLISVVAPGPGNNLFSPIFFHMTINANGEVTSLTTDFPPASCH